MALYFTARFRFGFFFLPFKLERVYLCVDLLPLNMCINIFCNSTTYRRHQCVVSLWVFLPVMSFSHSIIHISFIHSLIHLNALYGYYERASFPPSFLSFLSFLSISLSVSSFSSVPFCLCLTLLLQILRPQHSVDFNRICAHKRM